MAVGFCRIHRVDDTRGSLLTALGIEIDQVFCNVRFTRTQRPRSPATRVPPADREPRLEPSGGVNLDEADAVEAHRLAGSVHVDPDGGAHREERGQLGGALLREGGDGEPDHGPRPSGTARRTGSAGTPTKPMRSTLDTRHQ